MDEQQYETDLRDRILNKLEDLKRKIETNEPCPESEQDIGLLIHVSERIDECLDSWYY